MSGAVYQPTTVTYEGAEGSQDRWQDRPISYLASSVGQSVRRPCCLPGGRHLLPTILVVSGVLCLSLGLVMLIHGAVGYSDSHEDQRPDVYLIVTIFGAVFFALSILILVFFLRLTRRICWRNVKDHMSTSGGQSLTVNPSTDLLVAAQYAPVSEVAYQPTLTIEDNEEQSKLMPHSDTKDLTNEDTDRMVESDPRIVLRPLNNTHEET